MIILTTSLLFAAETATGKNGPLGGVGPATYDSNCGAAYEGVRFYRGKYDHWRRELGYTLAPRLEGAMNCERLRQRVRYWRTAAKINRVAAKTEARTLQNTGNWVRAMRHAQRPFPGTHDWLRFISNRECRACWTTPGAFVCNYQGSGACGPMQFMASTFYAYADDARRAVARRGYLVAAAVWDWRNPLGQALTAAYMRFTGRDGCHWCL